jgi:hypothetical protein
VLSPLSPKLQSEDIDVHAPHCRSEDDTEGNILCVVAENRLSADLMHVCVGFRGVGGAVRHSNTLVRRVRLQAGV